MGPGTVHVHHQGSHLEEIDLSLTVDGEDPVPAEMDYVVSALLGQSQIRPDTTGTEFQEEVWAYLATIPTGEIRTYAQVAEAIGRPTAARAVGGAVGANPWPILIPCHRVLGTDGSLTGFSGGLPWKEFLLRREGLLTQRLERWIDG